MKKHFITGVIFLFPAVVTIIAMVYTVNFLTKPFLAVAESYLGRYELFSSPFLLTLLSKCMILAVLLLLIAAVGFLGRLYFAHALFKMGARLIEKIPFVNKIYKSARDVIETLFAEKRQSFTQVVLAPFPHNGALGIGMITIDCEQQESDKDHLGLISVFMPATPNPTMGFMLLLKREQLIFLDMSVEEALKTVISCGVMFSDNLTRQKRQQIPSP